jgi:hypothetical protein
MLAIDRAPLYIMCEALFMKKKQPTIPVYSDIGHDDASQPAQGATDGDIQLLDAYSRAVVSVV